MRNSEKQIAFLRNTVSRCTSDSLMEVYRPAEVPVKRITLMTLSRQYVPAIGKSVKLKEWSDYSTRGIPVWSWMRVHSLNSDGAVVEVLNGYEPTGEVLTVPLNAIAPPIGWAPRYTIHAKPEKIDAVLSWFARGIVVRQSHDMSGSMPTAFQPMDNSEQPHWQFCEVTDAIPAAECSKVFRVVKIEREDIYDVYLVPRADCQHCKGSGRDSVARVNAYRAERGMDPCDTETVSHLGSRADWDENSQTFECGCVHGGFRTLGRSKRAKLIKEWSLQGWDTHYVNMGEHSYWERTRETVVQDWAS